MIKSHSIISKINHFEKLLAEQEKLKNQHTISVTKTVIDFLWELYTVDTIVYTFQDSLNHLK